MTRRNIVSSVEFVKVYGPLAKQGKSALEIGQALGFEGDAKKVAIAVSVKASQLRKRLIEAAQVRAKKEGLSDEDTVSLVETMRNKLPRIKGHGQGRKSDVNEIVATLDSVLAALDNPVVEPLVEPPTEPTVGDDETIEIPATETPKRSRRKLLG